MYTYTKKMWVLVTRLCLTLCDPIDYSSPGSSVLGIFQARILEGVAIPFSMGSSWPRDRIQVSYIADRFFYIIHTHVYLHSFRFFSHIVQFSSVQSLSHVQLFVSPWTTTRQASLSITNSQSPPKPMSIESVMPSNYLILVRFSSCPQSFPASRSFHMSQFFTSGGQIFWVSTSASILPINIQDWFPLGLTGWISLQSKGLSRVFSNTIIQKHQFFSAQLSLWFNSHIHIWLPEKP